MRVLVTRPEADAAALTADLQARGHEVLLQPLLTIEPVTPAPALDLTGAQALLFTSANGVRAFAALVPERSLPVFAVGDATAETARDLGFGAVESASGAVEDLAELVTARLDPAAGALLHGAGSSLAGDLKGALEAANFTVRRVVLYNARPTAVLDRSVRDAFAEGRLDAALFFSPRTAETFVTLVREHGLAADCARCRAVCLSPAVADKLAALEWAGTHVAERADRQALMDSLDGLVRDAVTADGRESGRQEPGKREIMADDSASNDAKPEDNGASGAAAAQAVISAFGGIRPMAGKLGLAVSTVQGWKQRNAIPASHHAQILAAAREHGIELDETRLAESDQGSPPADQDAAAGADEPRRDQEKEAAAEVAARPAADGKPGDTGKPAGPEPKKTATGNALAPQADKKPAGTPKPDTAEARKTDRPETAKSARTAAASGIPTSTRVEAAPRSPRAGAWLGGFFLGVLVMVIGAGVAVLTRDYWYPKVAGEPMAVVDAARMTEFGQRLREQAETLDALEAKFAARPAEGPAETPPQVDAALADLKRQAGQLTQRLKDLERGSGSADTTSDQLTMIAEANDALTQRLVALEGRLTDLDRLKDEVSVLAAEPKDKPAAQSGDLALMLALVQLRERLSGPAPYETELELLRGMIAGDPAFDPFLAPLDRYAADGAPALEALRREFAAVAGRIVAAAAGGEAEGVVAGVLRRLSDVVTVRPVGDVEGDDAGALVARAELKLLNGDLAGAVAELDGLAGPAAQAAAQWRARAESRLAVDGALAGLVAQVVGRLAPARG